MKAFLITYSLKKIGKDYSALKLILESFPKHLNYMPNGWLIATDENPVQIHQKIKPLLDDIDDLLIIEITANYYGWQSLDTWEWLGNNVTRT